MIESEAKTFFLSVLHILLLISILLCLFAFFVPVDDNSTEKKIKMKIAINVLCILNLIFHAETNEFSTIEMKINLT
jgi:hypothetical protein